MTIEPGSTCTLYANVQIARGDQPAFRGTEDQLAYFAARKRHENVAMSYLRPQEVIQVQLTTAQVAQCNYISFRNAAYEDILFFARITDYRYVNNVTTEISYAIDVYQTFVVPGKVSIGPGLIEREHLSKQEQSLAELDPWRNDVAKLLTAETFPVGETSYIHGSPKRILPDTKPDSQIAIYLFTSDWDRIAKPIPEAIQSQAHEIIYPSGDSKLKVEYDLPPRGYVVWIITDKTNRFLRWILMAIINWLTQEGLADSIMAIYWGALGIWGNYGNLHVEPMNPSTFIDTVMPSQSYSQSGLKNPKLLRSPYRYVQVSNFSGGKKDLLYELGNVYADYKRGITVAFFSNVDLNMCTTLVPYSYGIYGNESGYVLNWDERIEFRDFPQGGVTTDAYYAYVATQYQKVLAQQNDTVFSRLSQTASDWRQSDNTLQQIAGYGIGGAKTLMNTFSAAAAGGPLAGIAAGIPALAQDELNWTVQDEARKWATGNAPPPASSVFGPAQGAFVQDKYIGASGGNDMIPYISRLIEGQPTVAPGQFELVELKLRPEIEKMYDNYLTMYGLSYNAMGIPLIWRYLRGSTQATEIPYFAPDPYNSGATEITYCKARNLRVTANEQWVADAVESMFDAGVRFWRPRGGFASGTP